jgi:hypothetical protein
MISDFAFGTPTMKFHETEHGFQNAFKMAEALGTVHTRGKGLLGG